MTATTALLAEAQAKALLASLDAPAGAPADWWGEYDNEVAVFTSDPEVARRTAELLAQRDLECPYESLAGAISIEGPTDVVLIGSPDLQNVAIRPAELGDGYALALCRVTPAFPEPRGERPAGLMTAAVMARLAVFADDPTWPVPVRTAARFAAAGDPLHAVAPASLSDRDVYAALVANMLWRRDASPAELAHVTVVAPNLAAAGGGWDWRGWRCSCGEGAQGSPLSEAGAQRLARLHRRDARAVA